MTGGLTSSDLKLIERKLGVDIDTLRKEDQERRMQAQREKADAHRERKIQRLRMQREQLWEEAQKAVKAGRIVCRINGKKSVVCPSCGSAPRELRDVLVAAVQMGDGGFKASAHGWWTIPAWRGKIGCPCGREPFDVVVVVLPPEA